MKIGVISDTHDRLESIKKAIDIFKKERVGLIIHCGDWVSPYTLEYFDFVLKDYKIPVKSVFGNNEGDIKRLLERNSKLTNPIEFALKEVFEIKIGKRKIAVYHGQDNVILNALIKSKIYDSVFTGHTHIVKNILINNVFVLNPGSTCFAADSRIIKDASIAIYNSDSNSAKIITFRQ